MFGKQRLPADTSHSAELAMHCNNVPTTIQLLQCTSADVSTCEKQVYKYTIMWLERLGCREKPLERSPAGADQTNDNLNFAQAVLGVRHPAGKSSSTMFDASMLNFKKNSEWKILNSKLMFDATISNSFWVIGDFVYLIFGINDELVLIDEIFGTSDDTLCRMYLLFRMMYLVLWLII